ncbi:MAG: peptidylprolyl isomerase [Leptospirales bacterium]|nr:peptidylprolyl isomerase [Leptospirales bacterium]
MQIAANKVVTLRYRLTDNDGDLIDESTDAEPMAYIHGMGNIIPGLESALNGKGRGDSMKVTVPPAEGFGERDESLMRNVPRKAFDGVDDLQVGMQFQTDGGEGMEVVTVVGMEGDQITIDGNHPLAGVTLTFDLTILEVRDATKEEISHGHVHGPGGHHHH